MMDLSYDEDCFVLGTTVAMYDAVPLPFGNPTATQANRSMDYREHLCDCLDIGPVVLCMELQQHYGRAQQVGEPYRRFNIPNDRQEKNEFHCVTAYGYECPDETVGTLRLMYQENMIGAPGEEPQRGLYMDPDAFNNYYMPNISGMYLSNAPAEGYQTVHLSPPRSPSPPPPSSVWERILNFFS
ncbi:hypothetical protein ACP4OV_021748 [Aristida adscensionis]